MERNNEDKKDCSNCKYYVPHYILRETRFYEIKGHCTNDAYFRNRKQCALFCENCSYWEKGKDRKTEVRKTIDSVLRDIDNNLSYIRNVFESEK